MRNAPVLRLGSALWLNAWFDLDKERDRSELDPIRRSSAFEFARDYDLSEEQTEDLWYFTQKMDTAFLKYYKSKLPTPDKGGKTGRYRHRGKQPS